MVEKLPGRPKVEGFSAQEQRAYEKARNSLKSKFEDILRTLDVDASPARSDPLFADIDSPTLKIALAYNECAETINRMCERGSLS